MTVAIIDYGSGNLRSAAKSFERAAREAGLDLEVVVTADPERVRAAERVVLPGVGAFGDCRAGLHALPGMVAAFILCLILSWNEYFFAALLTSTDAKTLPVMVASQTGSQGINWWSMAALSTAAILPLVLIGIFLERYIIKGMTAGAVK